MTAEATVFIVDDDDAMLRSLQLLMTSVALPVRTFDSAGIFLQDYRDEPGCVITDMRMPGMSGLTLQERLLEAEYRIPVIFLTGHGDVPGAVRAMKRGAVDYLQKPFEPQQLLDLVNRSMESDAAYRTQAAAFAGVAQKLATLTPREHEVMELIVAGKANKVVAHDLGISDRTVELHRSRIMKKMSVRSLPELVRMVMPDV